VKSAGRHCHTVANVLSGADPIAFHRNAPNCGHRRRQRGFRRVPLLEQTVECGAGPSASAAEPSRPRNLPHLLGLSLVLLIHLAEDFFNWFRAQQSLHHAALPFPADRASRP
jgi:hypothetical protein